jgi:hypothetical protein
VDVLGMMLFRLQHPLGGPPRKLYQLFARFLGVCWSFGTKFFSFATWPTTSFHDMKKNGPKVAHKIWN